jgi:(2R)-3-sulfolactate dehydrogenase (NADP+)
LFHDQYLWEGGIVDQHLSLHDIEALAFTSLCTAGAREGAAQSMAKSIRAAERDGIRTHGLIYSPIYIEHLQSGNIRTEAMPRGYAPTSGGGACGCGKWFCASGD